MTVVLCGIGCDTTNVGRVAPVYEDGTFEYVPIPEKHRETAETGTYGNWELRHSDGVAADLLSSIVPQPAGGHRVSGDDLREWPLHRDPNFEALTYGEHRPGYVDRLSRLEPGDVVGFYAGLRAPDGDRTHRYLIGYFTVDGVEILPPEATREEAVGIFGRHPENAHAKRANDRPRFYADEAVAIVDGREPGGLFERTPMRLSEYTVAKGNTHPQYYLDATVADRMNVVEGRRNMQFKPAYLCDLDAGAFRELVGVPDEE